jgi:hypothetical protein
MSTSAQDEKLTQAQLSLGQQLKQLDSSFHGGRMSSLADWLKSIGSKVIATVLAAALLGGFGACAGLYLSVRDLGAQAEECQTDVASNTASIGELRSDMVALQTGQAVILDRLLGRPAIGRALPPHLEPPVTAQ